MGRTEKSTNTVAVNFFLQGQWQAIMAFELVIQSLPVTQILAVGLSRQI